MDDSSEQLTEEQLDLIKRSFNKMDQNNDGRLSLGEIIKGAQLCGQNPTKEEAEQMLKEFDLNGNGFVEFDEYLAMMKESFVTLDIEKERMKAAFQTLDQDNDGFITTRELRFALKLRDDCFSKQEIDQIVNEADINGDGRIDYIEFIESNLCKRCF
ncbi:hypothetical protein ScPMuIL_007487 [Solemya velum]